jgi:formate--tetrahydrofolate ligase
MDLAKKVVKLCEKKSALTPIYKLEQTLEEKINLICSKCYGAKDVEFSELAKQKLVLFNKLNYFVCVAKTPLSLTDDEKVLVIDKPFTIHVKDLLISNGARFIIVLTGNIVRMPGLPKIPEACKM